MTDESHESDDVVCWSDAWVLFPELHPTKGIDCPLCLSFCVFVSHQRPVTVQAYRVRRSTGRYGLSHWDQSRRDMWRGVITPHY